MKKKRRYRQAAALLLSAVLILSTGTGSSVFAEAEETETVTGQEQVIETESVTEIESPTETETVTGGETSEESELLTEPVTEPETDAETEPVTEPETAGETSGESEPETEPVTEKELETQKTPQVQVQSTSPAQNQILTVSEMDEAVQNVQDQIDALPTAAEVGAMSQEEQQNAYMQAQNVWDAYAALTAEQQAQVDESKLTELLDYFNGQVQTQPSAGTVATVTINGTTREYSNIDDALNAANGNTATITLYQNVTLNRSNFTIESASNITFIGGNFSLSFSSDASTATLSVNGILTIESGTINAYVLTAFSGILNLNGGTVYSIGSDFANSSSSSININGGTVSNMLRALSGVNVTINSGNVNTLYIFSGGSVIVNGGTIGSVTGNGSNNITYQASGIRLNQTTLSLTPGGSGTLTATVMSNNITVGGSAYTFPVSWSSDNQGVATVDSNGKVTAVATGAATITASAGGKTATCTVTVNNPAPTIELTVKNGEGTEVNNIAYGSTVTLEANVKGNNGVPVTGGTVDFYRGAAEEGNKLNVTSVPVSNGTATADIQITGESWKPDDTTSYSIIAVYTPAEGVSVSGGSQTASLTVDKATPDALPDGPNILKGKTTTSVTLNPVDNDGADIYGTILYGYITGDETSVPEDRWQNSNEFTNLSPGTDYNFFTRYAGNDYYNPSNRSYFGYLITTLPSITTTSLISGYVGVEYKAQLAASVADNKTVTWTLANWASLPDGLTLDAETGVISGVPKVAAASHSFTVQASIDGIDSYEQITNTATLTITIERGTPADPKEGEGYTINYEEETVTAWDGYELSVSENETGSGTLTVTPGTNVYVRLKETVTYYASNWVEVTIPARPDAPDLSIDTQAEGMILSENYCYSFNSSTDAGDWQQGSGQLIKVEPEDTIYIYEAAVNSGENPHFRSEIKSITAPARTNAPSIPSIDYTNEKLNGTLGSMEYRVGENGSWTPCIDGAMDLEQYFGWNGTDKVDVYFRTAAANSSYASEPTQALTIPARPTLKLGVTNVSANGFEVTVTGAPTDAALTYRARGTGEYDDYDSGERTSGIFTGLKANALYDVSVECAATSNTFSAEAIGTGTTGVATYTVSIPSQATAGGKAVSISITEDTAHPFDLGNGGQVNVKIIDDENIDNGVLTLTREGTSNTVTSALSVGESPFTDLSQNVATFTEDSKDPVSLSFAAPTEKDIPAGTYKGTVNFEISYTQ